MFLTCFFIIFICFASRAILGEEIIASATSQPLLTYSDMAADAGWEFEVELEGWAASTTEEMQAEVYQKNGEMRVQINGAQPHFDSPQMMLKVVSQETIVTKYRYVGPSTRGKVQVFVCQLNATSMKDVVADRYFYIRGDGNWHIAYIPLESSSTVSEDFVVSRVRLWPATFRPADNNFLEASPAPNQGNSLHIN